MTKPQFLRDFWYGLSSNQRFFIRKLYYLPSDLRDRILGRTHKYVPSRGDIYTGSPANAKYYIKQGELHLQHLKIYIDLQPNDSVLDIGSGVGRSAIALSSYLNQEGSYDGFDVVKQGVDWCNKGLGKDFPNFNFKYVPLFNDLYNTSTLKASEFQFPYEDASFNKVFSVSLFTHMQIDEIQHYFHQIYRVLKSGGLCFSTFFLYDETDEAHISAQKDFNFPHKKEGYRLMNTNVTSGNIAIHKTKLANMISNANLELVTIVDGFWRGQNEAEDRNEYQDIVVFKKP
ncbi:class I SAM-dependent methyltransferase [Winogradskyella jejuensis]|uniref:Methyltransferase domain-containing protein n=1 Tax=Winogradskyella jejuensis TaxID=1089305 RepID=A0A1M5LPQ9_9FLAO|nr:class I SAM-dependent methyltransferase [Winogradskyella jejuensis]SHG67094.1 Methyltransferase domain-containing protein [Winogradskyella jejuensis]